MKCFNSLFLTLALFAFMQVGCGYLVGSDEESDSPSVKKTSISRESSNNEANNETQSLELYNVKAEVFSANQVLLSWTTNIPTSGEVDIRLVNTNGTTDEVANGIPHEYPPLNLYKQHRLLLVSGDYFDFLPGRTYKFTVRAMSEDGQEKSKPGSSFRVKASLDLALFVQNSNKEVLVFPFPEEREDLGPSIKISNPSEHKLIHTAYDSKRDLLYFTTVGVNGILVFTDVSDPQVPSKTRMIKGGNTGLSSPSGIFIDEESDTLYVANKGSNSITVYSRASFARGNILPDRTIKGSYTWIKAPNGIALDVERDVVYLSCHYGTGDMILAFYPASEIDGNVKFSASLYGPQTKIKAPVDIAFDQVNKHLYVLNSDGNVPVFHERKGEKYLPDSPGRINGKKAPSRILYNKNWWMTFSPNNSGGLAFDSSSNRLFISGKPIEESTGLINVFDNASEIPTGDVEPTVRIDAPSGIISAMGLSLKNSGDILYAVTYNKRSRSIIVAYDISKDSSAAVLPISSATQVSAFKSDLSGLSFDTVSEKLFVLAGNYLAFGKETIQTGWNYYNADLVVENFSASEGEDEDFSNLSRIKTDGTKSIFYSLNEDDGSVEAFDNWNQHTGQTVFVDPSRKIAPDFYNHKSVDFALDAGSDIMYLLMEPQSSIDRNLKVLVYSDVSTLDGIIQPNKVLSVTELPHSNMFSCVEIDSVNDRLFVSVTGKVEIYENLSELQGTLEPSKTLEGAQSKIGTPQQLYFYQPENELHTSYLLISNVKKSSSGFSGILGFDNTSLDGANTTVTPVYKLGGSYSEIMKPGNIAVGTLAY